MLAKDRPFFPSRSKSYDHLTTLDQLFVQEARQKIFQRHRCNQCSSRMKQFLRCSSYHAPLFIDSLTPLCKGRLIETDKQFYIDILRYSRNIIKEPVCGVQILLGDHILHKKSVNFHTPSEFRSEICEKRPLCIIKRFNVIYHRSYQISLIQCLPLKKNLSPLVI